MKTRTYTQDDVNAWNWAHPVSSECIMIADEITIGALGFRTRTRSSAWLLPSGHAVVSLEGRTGGHSIDRVLFVASEYAPPAQPVAPTEDSVAGMQLIAHIPSC